MRLRSAIQLIPALLLGGAALAVDGPAAVHLDSYTWEHDADWFGGLSAIEMSPDGTSMTLLSDQAHLATARVQREGDRITGIEMGEDWLMYSSRGRLLRGWAGDAEGLAIGPDGTIYISFEGMHRVVQMPTPEARTKVLPRPQEFRTMSSNGAFEALARDAQGRLYTMPEKDRDRDGQIPVYRWDGERWSIPFTLSPRGRFRPVAADFGPDGRLYLLERSVSVMGFRSRLRRWDMAGGVPVDEVILLETASGTHDNLEGLSVWRDEQGRLRASMISDDNFMALQRTELVEYVLPE